jgi:hypothetical protein
MFIFGFSRNKLLSARAYYPNSLSCEKRIFVKTAGSQKKTNTGENTGTKTRKRKCTSRAPTQTHGTRNSALERRG